MTVTRLGFGAVVTVSSKLKNSLLATLISQTPGVGLGTAHGPLAGAKEQG